MVEAFNEKGSISYAIYNGASAAGIVGPLVLLLQDRRPVQYMVQIVGVTLFTVVSLACLFVPKCLRIRNGDDVTTGSQGGPKRKRGALKGSRRSTGRQKSLRYKAKQAKALNTTAEGSGVSRSSYAEGDRVSRQSVNDSAVELVGSTPPEAISTL